MHEFLLLECRKCILLFSFSLDERVRIIADAINDAKQSVHERESLSRLIPQRIIGPLSSADLLADGFKRPSKEAAAQGNARLLMEDMVHRAEKELERERIPLAQTSRDSYREPGSLLENSEVTLMYRESGCQAARPVPRCNYRYRYRTIDGTCNNLRRPLQGSAHTAFRRLISSKYEDGISDMIGKRQSTGKSIKQGGVYISSGPFDPPYPSTRWISQRIVSNDSSNELPLTHMVMQWGQFLDHDLDLAPEPEDVKCGTACLENDVCQPIHIHPKDRVFGGTSRRTCMPFKRSIPACTSTTSGRFSARQQINDLTSYIDGSQIYGSSNKIARKLRTFSNGQLRTSSSKNLPYTTEDCLMGTERCFFAGDVRSNEQVGLTAMHTLWVREHNRIAKQLKILNGGWNDEKLYQETRKIIGAMLQKITYKDFLPKLMGSWILHTLIPPYKGYNASVDASIPNAFATAAFRFGHSLIRPVFSRYLSDQYERGTNKPLNLLNSFFNIKAFQETKLSAIFRGLATDSSRRMDESLNSVLTTQLFKKTSAPGLDLASLNLQRQRDHGLPSYTVWRNYCLRQFPRLPMAVMRSHTLHRQLLRTYQHLENVDFWLGGISEERLRRSVLGPTFACIFGLTFQNLRDGDRFWYERPGVFTSLQRREINKASLSRVICDNTDINLIQKDSLKMPGRVWNKRVRCFRLPKMNLKRWQSRSTRSTCYMKIRHTGGKGVQFTTSYTEQKLHYVYRAGSLTSSRYGCIKIQCPLSYSRSVSIGVRPSRRCGNRQCTLRSINSRLPRNRATDNSRYYGTGFTPSIVSNRYSGIYRTSRLCWSGRYSALTYRCTIGTIRHVSVNNDLRFALGKRSEEFDGDEEFSDDEERDVEEDEAGDEEEEMNGEEGEEYDSEE